MTMTGGSVLTAEELLLYRSARPERSLPRKGRKEFAPNNSWLHKKQIENILDERKSLLEEERVERVGALSIAIWDESSNLAIVTYMIGRHWEIFGHKYASKLALHPEEALFLLETSNLQLLHNDVSLSIQQGYSTLLGSKTGCPLNHYKVYAHLVRHGFRILRHTPPSVTDYEHQIGLHHYLDNKSQTTPSRTNNPQSEASNIKEVDISNSSSESISSSIDNIDIKDSDFPEIKSDEDDELKMKLHLHVDDPLNIPVREESHCADKGPGNVTALDNSVNNKANMEVAKNDEYSSLNVEIPKTSATVTTAGTEKEISEQESCSYEKIEMIDDCLFQNKNNSEYVNGVKCRSPDNKQLNLQEIVVENNIPEVGENRVRSTSCVVGNVGRSETFPEVFVISDSSDDSEAIDVETIAEEHNFLSSKFMNNSKNNTELDVKQFKLDAECEIIDVGCKSAKSTGKNELNTSENVDVIFVNEIKKPHTSRSQKRRSELLKDCVIDVETDSLIRNDQVMPRKKVKSNPSNCPIESKASVINCEIVDISHGEVRPDKLSNNVHLKTGKSSFYEVIDVELEHTNKSNLQDRQSILSSFPNFANSEKAVVKLPDPKFLPPNVTPDKTEYTLYFHHGNERMMRPYRHQNYRQRGFGNCNSTHALVGSSNMERQSFPWRNTRPDHFGPRPQQFKVFMGPSRYDDYNFVPNNVPSNVYNNLHFQQPFVNTCSPYETGLLPCTQNQFQQPHFNQHQQEFVSQCDQIMERQFYDSSGYASVAQNSQITPSRKGRREHYRRVDEYERKNPMMNKKNRPRFNSNRYFAPSKKFQPQMEHNYVMEIVNREWKQFLKNADGAKSWSEMKHKKSKQSHELKVEENYEIKEEDDVELDISNEAEKEEMDVKPLLEPSDCLNIGNVLSKLQIFQEPKFQNAFAHINSELIVQYDLYLPNKKFKKSSPSTPDFRVCVVGCESDIPSQRDIALLYRRFQDNVPLLFAVVISGSVAFYHFSNVRLPEDRSVPT